MASKLTRYDKALISAIRSTINKLMAKARTQATKKVREAYNIKAKDLKAATKLKRASNRRLGAELIVEGKKLPLIFFGARQTRKGTTVRIKKAEGRKTIKSAFIATMPSGKLQVWMRERRERLPIKQLFTLSPAQMFEQEGEETAAKLIEDESGRVFEKELEFYLSRR